MGSMFHFEAGELKKNDEHVCDYQCWDWSKGSKALIASDGEKALIIDHIGGPTDYWASEGGDLQDEFTGVEAGVWIWEGSLVSHRDYWGEYDEELVGDFRKLTTEEWELLHGGDELWADEHESWRSCNEEDGNG